MKFNIIIPYLILTVLMNMLDALAYVAIIGPKDEVTLYQRNVGDIEIYYCKPGTENLDSLRTGFLNRVCEVSDSIRIDIDNLKYAFRNKITADKANVLNPLTKNEVFAFINDRRKENQIDQLSSLPDLKSALYKIETQFTMFLDMIISYKELTILTYDKNKNNFLYNLFSSFDPNLSVPCGLGGSLKDRIEACALLKDPNNMLLTIGERVEYDKEYNKYILGTHFYLVMSSLNYDEFYQDISTSHFWSDRLPKAMTYSEAKSACESFKEPGFLENYKWELPSIQEYKIADELEIRKQIKNNWKDADFWAEDNCLKSKTCDIVPSVFSGNNGTIRMNNSNNKNWVRCIAKKNKDK